MKKLILSLVVIATFVSGYSQKITNAEGSNYSFTEIAHLDANPVQSQGYTGTCWSFAALSFFESEMIRKGVDNPPVLSEMYVARKSYEEKADRYIRLSGKANFSQGGEADNIPYVFKKYGIVPQEVYEGLNYGRDKHNHQELYKGLNGYVQGILDYVKHKGNNPLSTEAWKNGLNGILDAYLGKDPKHFTYKGKDYTPKSFAKSTGLDMDDYVSLTSFKSLPLHEEVQLLIPDNWIWSSAYNVKLDEMFNTVVHALKNGYTVNWATDVSEKGFNFRKGLAIVPEDESSIHVKGSDNSNFSDAGARKEDDAFYTPVKELEITPELRQKGYDNQTTTDDHGMHITGLYKGADGKRYFLVKNSWGTGNLPKGYLYVSENYFKYKTIAVYLNKKAIPKKVTKKLSF